MKYYGIEWRNDYLVVIAIVIFVFGFVHLMPVQAAPPASEEKSACEAAGTAEGQTLYACNVDGTLCVWDPSPTLGAGVLDCDW